ncbi:putative quinol monooxygenase [Oceanicella sp. SM1341]|uniref:putative quinol monooxygenase n=1 Tax=Oceanicella sp. SM1341 TaxID=1548889 RepID=UPI000E4E1CCC|nr:putative quinol monooxygenase [Oceanicella sp. SM1341]
MTKVTIVANIHAKDDRIDVVKAELLKLLPITRAEDGCITYDLHQNDEDPAHFIMLELWQSRELLQNHSNAPHMAAFKAATADATTAFTVHKLTRIG